MTDSVKLPRLVETFAGWRARALAAESELSEAQRERDEYQRGWMRCHQELVNLKMELKSSNSFQSGHNRMAQQRNDEVF